MLACTFSESWFHCSICHLWQSVLAAFYKNILWWLTVKLRVHSGNKLVQVLAEMVSCLDTMWSSLETDGIVSWETEFCYLRNASFVSFSIRSCDFLICFFFFLIWFMNLITCSGNGPTFFPFYLVPQNFITENIYKINVAGWRKT